MSLERNSYPIDALDRITATVSVIGRNVSQIFKTGSPALQNRASVKFPCKTGELFLFHNLKLRHITDPTFTYEGWNFNSGNYLFTTDTK